MNPKLGEVWLADLGLAAKLRPIVIVSWDDPDPPRALIIYVPLTTQNRQSVYEVILPKLRFLNRDSVANVQGIGSLPKARLERRLGKLPDKAVKDIKAAISFALALENKT
jgi:mRNA interferase MazF